MSESFASYRINGEGLAFYLSRIPFSEIEEL